MSAKFKSELQYRFGEHEPLPDGTHRILCEQLAGAISALSDKEISLEDAVHEARRCLKRTRSFLRLVRFAIPIIYEMEDRRLKIVSRSLSELRDSHALIETLRDLETRVGDGQGNESDSVFARALELLRTREEQIEKQLVGNQDLERSITLLKNAQETVRRQNFRKVSLGEALKSVQKSWKRGKKAFAATGTDSQPEKFHDWRKRTKDLRYELAVLSDLRPDLEEYSGSAKKLEQHLGEDHNLAVLAGLLTEDQLGKAGADLLREAIDKRQAKLREKTKDLGEEIYGDKSKIWEKRLNASAAHTQVRHDHRNKFQN